MSYKKPWNLISIVTIGILAIGLFLLCRDKPIASNPDWPQDVKRFANVVTGKIRVVDANSGATIFSYYDDPKVYPDAIQKTPEGNWLVIFVPMNSSSPLTH